MRHWLKFATLSILWTVSFEAKSPAAELRPAEQEHWQSGATSPTSFRTVPSTHLSPSDNSLSLGSTFEYQEARANKGTGEQASEFMMSKRGASPFVALSGKRFGLAITGDFGVFDARLKDEPSSANEKSSATYNGFGLYAFAKHNLIAERLQLTSSLGSKILSAGHHAQSKMSDEEQSRTLSYRILQHEAGLNLELMIGKHLGIIPWTHFRFCDTSAMSAAIAAETNPDANTTRFESDEVLFWNPGPQMGYGIDVAVYIAGFEFHFGNIIDTAYALSRKDRQGSRSFGVGTTLIYEFKK